ncbi:conserved protein, unknown function [Hepatocystis sp. ex Piliocolobus tephrosceles]|nr:conserved protein, unknown function [Hepatocystis sp. ex Piliocolobus tephrosceles]
MKNNMCDTENKIMAKYRTTVEASMEEDMDISSNNNKSDSNYSDNNSDNVSYEDSEESIISDKDVKKSVDSEGDITSWRASDGDETEGQDTEEEDTEEGDTEEEYIEGEVTENNGIKTNVDDICDDNNNNNNNLLNKIDNNKSLTHKKANNNHKISSSDSLNEDSDNELNENVIEEEEEYNTLLCAEEDKNKSVDEQKEKGTANHYPDEKKNKLQRKQKDASQFYGKRDFVNMETIQMCVNKNEFFNVEINDINDWKTKYRYLTSSFRKIEKELSKTVNNENIHMTTRQTIKQHKDFLDNEYKAWSGVQQKTVSEFKKNISAHISELNEKEYLILSKKICEDLKEKNLEEVNINIILYLLVTKHEISIESGIMEYLKDCYISINTDQSLNKTIEKINEANKNIEDLGGKTGMWTEDDNNYFINVYENNSILGDNIVVDLLKSRINKSEEEIYKHIDWYKNFMSINKLKNKYINNISIFNINVKIKIKK